MMNAYTMRNLMELGNYNTSILEKATGEKYPEASWLVEVERA